MCNNGLALRWCREATGSLISFSATRAPFLVTRQPIARKAEELWQQSANRTRFWRTTMTLYSCLPAQGKVTVIATWPGEYAESHSAKITTFTDPVQASRIAEDLTRLSESMWDAAAWLDIYEEAEARLKTVICAIRGTADVPAFSTSSFEW